MNYCQFIQLKNIIYILYCIFTLIYLLFYVTIVLYLHIYKFAIIALWVNDRVLGYRKDMINMIENLQGVHETVNYGNDSILRLYDNWKIEDYPPHWHIALEIIVPTTNTYGAVCNNVPFNLNETDILFIQPAVLHRLESPKQGRRIILQISLIHLTFLKSFSYILSVLPPAFVITKNTYPELHSRIYNTMLEILTEYQNNSMLHELSIYSKVLQMLVAISNEYTVRRCGVNIKPNLQQDYIVKFTHICDYIEEHLTENLTLDNIAYMAGFSKFHFERLFKQFTDCSFYQYVNIKRINHVEMLLVNPDISITEAAYRSGFTNTSAFNRMFKLHKQCTPSEFRKMFQN